MSCHVLSALTAMRQCYQSAIHRQGEGVVSLCLVDLTSLIPSWQRVHYRLNPDQDSAYKLNATLFATKHKRASTGTVDIQISPRMIAQPKNVAISPCELKATPSILAEG